MICSYFGKRNAGTIDEPAHDAGPFPSLQFLLGDDQAASVGPERARLAHRRIFPQCKLRAASEACRSSLTTPVLAPKS